MDDIVSEFQAYLREERMLADSTIHRYARVASKFMQVRGGPLEAAAPEDISGFLRSVREKTSATTWNIELAALRSFFGFAVRLGLAQVNPAMTVDTVRVSTRERDPLSFDEVMRLLGAVDAMPRGQQSRNRLIIHLLFQCAFRVSELVSLDLAHVDLEGRLFASVRRKGGKHVSTPFNDLVAASLDDYLDERGRLDLPKSQVALLVSQRRTRLTQRGVQGLITTLGQRAGISRPVTPHLLRHSNVTQLVRIGTPLPVVQEICGHASLSTTRRYVHVSNGQRRDAINALGDAWHNYLKTKGRPEAGSGRREKG